MPNIFQGQLVRLRGVELSDWEVHYNWDFDTDNGRMTDEVWFPSSREEVRAWVEGLVRQRGENDEFRFQIERIDPDGNNEMVGTLNTHSCNRRCGTFMYGIAIRPPHRGKGYASEAIRLVLRYFFHERRYQKVTAEVFSFNKPSIRLHEKLGFTLEGRLRRMLYTQGQYFDALMYGMIREEFESSGWNPDNQHT